MSAHIKAAILAVFLLAFGACEKSHMSAQIEEMSTPDGRLRRAERELAAASPSDRRYRLGDAAKNAFDTGDFDKAERYIGELERASALAPHDWDYGNTVQNVNIVRGRMALRMGNKAEAKQRLLAAGRSPGSPQMNSFGPNMSLANDLLQVGERDIVIEYLALCRVFWVSGRPKLDQWTEDIRAGRSPQFGPNLIY
ncbi:MAG TPA: hypothetical protein VFS55_02275 [Dokdonella sp.]|nr:hypothetical protein [Dokdonella sp.]